jgi:L-alanine-DL-glutamate epimerase-like enolase superfamily enzyme
MPVGTLAIEAVDADAYVVPTDAPESDGTLEWNSTTMVAVHIRAGGLVGFGYSYCDAAAVHLIRGSLRELLLGMDAFQVTALYDRMVARLRNNGEGGLGRMAIAAVDNALWDLSAKALGVSVSTILGGRHRDAVAVYGSGGFTSYTHERLQKQLGGWADAGIGAVKMKIGREPLKDPQRVKVARKAIEDAALYVDANAAFHVDQAVEMAALLNRYGVTWFEEPVHHRDRTGLAMVRQKAPAGMSIAAGEYGVTREDPLLLIQAGCVDVLQADATRCGITGFMRTAALCDAFHLPMSSHCAPALHLQPCLAAGPVRNMEYFHDHVRLEGMLLEGVVEQRAGMLRPDEGTIGLGLSLRKNVAKKFLVT